VKGENTGDEWKVGSGSCKISGLASFLPWLVMFFDVIYADMKFSKGMSLILA
jgi:hypothetical protein